MNVLESYVAGEALPDYVGGGLEPGFWSSAWNQPIDALGSTRLVTDLSVNAGNGRYVSPLPDTSVWIVAPGQSGSEHYAAEYGKRVLLLATPRVGDRHDYQPVLDGKAQLLGTLELADARQGSPRGSEGKHLAGEIALGDESFVIRIYSVSQKEAEEAKAKGKAVRAAMVVLPLGIKRLLPQPGMGGYKTPTNATPSPTKDDDISF